ncbi:MAG TPA: hypothetical protein VGS98_10145 [Thermoanaerobaculia bacterium]|jgi:hypothetical protein|nr:hypothetical protein [Thermoanaerobaculia bacterium]
MKNTVALTREKWDRRTLAGAGLWAALVAGELATAVYLFASGNVSPVLVRSLQLFLRF